MTHGAVVGGIPVLDPQYGTVGSNSGKELFLQVQPKFGDVFRVKISHGTRIVRESRATYGRALVKGRRARRGFS